MKKGAFLMILLLPAVLFAQADQKEDVWQTLRFLEGTWTGQGDGMSGVSNVTQTYAFILGSKFMEMRTRSEFKPQEKNPKGEIHEDLGLFSYDGARKTFVLRSFYVEGGSAEVMPEVPDPERKLARRWFYGQERPGSILHMTDFPTYAAVAEEILRVGAQAPDEMADHSTTWIRAER